MKKEFVRNPYNYDSDELSEDTGLKCLDQSLTEQEHLEETDINYIADKFMRTGEVAQVPNMPEAGDFSGIFDFQSAMNIIVQAKQEFMALPAKVRTRFQNDPKELIAFLEDPDNNEESIKLGLRNRPDELPTEPPQLIKKGTQKEPQKTEGKTPQNPPQ